DLPAAPRDQATLEGLAALPALVNSVAGSAATTVAPAAPIPVPNGSGDSARAPGAPTPAQALRPPDPQGGVGVLGAGALAGTVANDDCDCEEAGNVIRTTDGTPLDRLPRGTSPAGLRYFDGLVRVNSPELISRGFGVPWGQSRVWTNAAVLAPGNVAGKGMAL